MNLMKQAAINLEAIADTARRTAAEGCVLLRNEHQALPLAYGSRIAVFGRAQMNYFKSGLGSGGLVNVRYVKGVWEALSEEADVTLDQTLRAAYEGWTKVHPFDMGDGWANHPWFQQEMPLTEDQIACAAQRNDAALILLGRTAGEDHDNSVAPGSWLLTKEEEEMLALVCQHFRRSIVLLNVGNIIDMTWVERYRPAAVMYIWQGGQDGGSGTADVLLGRVAPCGRLTDTIARHAEDYPSHESFGDDDQVIYTEDIYVGYRYFETLARDKVLYPFGSGLSYTEFRHEPVALHWQGDTVRLRHRVQNTGGYAAKEVVQVYVEIPQGKLGQPQRILCAYAKTETLQPGQIADITFDIPVQRLASYDDSGVTGHRSCYVMEAGQYRFFAGHDVRQAEMAGTFNMAQLTVINRCEEACAPKMAFQRLHPINGCAAYEAVPLQTVVPAERRKARFPQEIPQTGDRGIRLLDVHEGRSSMEWFIGQLTDDELCCIVRGEGMSSPRVTPGTAGAIGGVSDHLAQHYGIPAACCADGPSGIRMDCGNKAYAMPNGTCLACTWNDVLVEQLYACEGLEMRKYQVDTLLGPGMNIHRSPLNGRNFEYFSEDPLLTGKMAAAQLRGLHTSGVDGTIKHFACNNQEHRRSRVNAVVSERALREIYLKGFEIAVKEGSARSIMTSYNPINGCWTASHYDLTTTLLRKEWGFDGIVMTDWWAMGSEEDKEPSTRNVSAMIRAQNDLFMVANEPEENSGNDDSLAALSEGCVTRAEYQRSAMNICRYVMTTPAFRRLNGQTNEIDLQLQKLRDEEEDVILSLPEVLLAERTLIPGLQINTKTGGVTQFQMKLEKRGQYRFEVTCRASDGVPGTAQMPVSVFVDSQLLGTKTLSGAEKEWVTLTFDTWGIRRRLIFYTKFFIAVGGLEIKEVCLTRIQTFE
ncbi:MAG: glycoside hydrolase family 3 C-terminal domain-containing protein [bacterium]|nr:glycoside hydrolase family 3 C-terminal domain-containing protein [bacterium]